MCPFQRLFDLTVDARGTRHEVCVRSELNDPKVLEHIVENQGGQNLEFTTFAVDAEHVDDAVFRSCVSDLVHDFDDVEELDLLNER